MEPIEKNQYYCTNKIAHHTIEALGEVVGKNGLNAVLNLAHLTDLIGNYPADDLERDFDFADFSAFTLALEEMYGPRGGRGLAMRAGREAFTQGLRNFGVLAGVNHPSFQELQLQTKLRIGIPAIARTFFQILDQSTTVQETEDEFLYSIHRCPACWGRQGADKPVCFVEAGFLQESLKWLSGGNEFRVNESRCVAMGDEACEFIIQKIPMS